MVAAQTAPAELRHKSKPRDERWLARVWQRQAFDRHNLQTTSGIAFRVVYPGRHTGEAGPDFQDAILALADGRLLRGDVELHVHGGGWFQMVTISIQPMTASRCMSCSKLARGQSTPRGS